MTFGGCTDDQQCIFASSCYFPCPLFFFRHSSGWHRQHLVLDPQEKRTPIWSSECVMNLNPFWSMSANTGRKVRPWPLCLQEAKPSHFFSNEKLIQIWGGVLCFWCLWFFPSRFCDSTQFHIFPLEKRGCFWNCTPVSTWRHLFCNLVRLELATPEVVETLNFYLSSPQHFCLLV